MDRIIKLINKEEKRQENTLMLIPSENYTYPKVRKAVGSVLMHKYAEGYPKRRMYQGNEFVDEIESECISRALKLFKLSPGEWSVNVQPHSGSPANLSVYNAVLNPGDRILSMHLPDGGHLSHGWHTKERKVTLVSKIFNVNFYFVDPKSKVFDYEEIEKIALNFKPKLIVSGGTAYPREIDHKKMKSVASRVGAYYLADIAHEAGLVAGGVNTSPFKYADFVTMTTHKTLRGPRGAMVFSKQDYKVLVNSSVFPGLQGGPHINTIAGIAIALDKANTNEFKGYANQVVSNARILSESLLGGGLDVVSGGTDKHLLLVDLRNLNTTGWHVANALEKAGIIVNRNTVPGETNTAYYPSGIRLGTPAITVRGMKEGEMKIIGGWIAEIVKRYKDLKMPVNSEERKKYIKRFKNELSSDNHLVLVNKKVIKLCSAFPIK